MSENKKTLTRDELEEEIIKKVHSDQDFEKLLMEKPHEAVSQFGVKIPEKVEIKVMKETANVVYLVLPFNPEEVADKLTEEQLQDVVGGYGTCRDYYYGCLGGKLYCGGWFD